MLKFSVAVFIIVVGIATGVLAETKPPLQLGSEIDVLPYLTGGYYGSVWVGREHLRVRPVLASVTVPSFATEDGFDQNKLKAYAFIADYFFQDDLSGLWTGAGMEYWDASIRDKETKFTSDYHQTVATWGGGYVVRLGSRVDLNPWVAFHFAFGGEKEVVVGSKIFKPKRVQFEGSVKIGIRLIP